MSKIRQHNSNWGGSNFLHKGINSLDPSITLNRLYVLTEYKAINQFVNYETKVKNLC